MEDKNEHNNTKDNEMITGHSRRQFIASATTAVVGVSAAGIFTLPEANAAPAKKNTAVGTGPFPTEGMAAYSPEGPHKLMKFERRALGPNDVAIRMHYCGICHSDIHTIRGDWGKQQYPLITGHELAGEVVATGTSVSKFQVGARVGVGTMVDSCRTCTECQSGHENYCLKGNTQTYGSKDKNGEITQGGYSKFIVVDENYVINIPDAIDLAEAGPLLCAGITVYSPLRRWGVSPGKKVAIFGLGGLGHLAVKSAKAMGAEVTVFTTSPDKVSDAKRFGAKDVVINKEGADYTKYKHAFDFALDTIPYKHNIDPFIPLLKRDAVYCRVGVGKASDTNEVGQMGLVFYRNSFAGSNTGGIQETQDFINFCAANKIKPEITKVSMNGVDDAWKKVFDKQARYRYVIDMKA